MSINKSQLILGEEKRDILRTWKGIFVSIVAIDHLCFTFYFPKYGVDHLFLYILNFFCTFSLIGLFGITSLFTISKLNSMRNDGIIPVLTFLSNRFLRYFPFLIIMILLSMFFRFIILKYNFLGGEITYKLPSDLFMFRNKFEFSFEDILRTLKMEGAYFVNVSSPSWTIYLGWWLTILTLFLKQIFYNKNIFVKLLCSLGIYFILINFFNTDNYIYLIIWCLYSVCFLLFKNILKDYNFIILSFLIFIIVLTVNKFNYKVICNSNFIFISHSLLFVYFLFKINKNEFFRKVSSFSYLWFLIHTPIYLFVFSLTHQYFENSLWKIILSSSIAFILGVLVSILISIFIKRIITIFSFVNKLYNYPE
jgi:peptidoglycan/LPS O-acetylase OafA/YrhL